MIITIYIKTSDPLNNNPEGILGLIIVVFAAIELMGYLTSYKYIV
tara:strand:+ start:294 stop:428 length:135 start_codon:yes stop_codon:yes gene_type:complete